MKPIFTDLLLHGTDISPTRQIRQGTANNTKGTCFVVYEDVVDAKQACDKLNGFNFQNRYLVGESKPLPSCLRFWVADGKLIVRIVLYHQPEKVCNRYCQERFMAAWLGER